MQKLREAEAINRKKMEKIDYDFVENISLKKDFEIIYEKVSVIIFT